MRLIAETPSRHPRRLLILGLVCSNLLVFAFSAYSLLESRQQYELRAQKQTQNIALAVEENLSNSIEKIDLALLAVADELERQLAGKGIDGAAMNAFLARHERRLPEVEAFRVADAGGLVILGKGLDKKARASWADREYYRYHRDHADRTLQISKPRMGRVAKRYIVGFSQRYNFPDGRFAGVISAPIALEHFSRLLSNFDVGPNGAVALRDIDLGLIARIPPFRVPEAEPVGNSIVSNEFRRLAASGVSSSTFRASATPDGVRRTLTFRRLNKAQMYVLVGAASLDYLAAWNDELVKTVAVASGFLLLSLLLGGMLLRLFVHGERRERALAESEGQLRTLVEAVPDSIQFKDGEGRWLIANSVCLRLFGLEGKPWRGLTDAGIGAARPPVAAGAAVCWTGDDAVWQARAICRSEERVTCGGGEVRHFEVIRVPLFDERDRRRALVVVGRDVTAQKRGEAELERYRHDLEQLVQQRTAALLETEARATYILNSSADGLYGVDRDGIVTFINPAACALLGYRAEAVVGRAAHALFHHSRPDGTPYPVEECHSHTGLRVGKAVRVDDEVFWHADGHAVPVMYATHPIVHNGEVKGAVTSFVDVGVQRAAARAREQALIAAERLARVRSEFLANMSHEIRTPLNGVLGFADIGYRNCDNGEKARDAFAKIKTSGNRLLAVVNDILDFSKIEAGKLGVEQTAVVLPDVIDHALALVRDRAAARQLDLRAEIAADLPRTCTGDPRRLGQVLLNVLSNAVKFTEAGSVTLAASRQGDELVFRVSDTGIGMDEELLGQLFNPFQQADGSAARRFGGAGLGLAIGKRILELMGGDIRVDSRPGAGTTVELRLPYVPAASPEA